MIEIIIHVNDENDGWPLRKTATCNIDSRPDWFQFPSLRMCSYSHGGIPDTIAHCQACFDLQGNEFCLQGNGVCFAFCIMVWLQQISAALQIKTSLTMGNGIRYPTQCILSSKELYWRCSQEANMSWVHVILISMGTLFAGGSYQLVNIIPDKQKFLNPMCTRKWCQRINNCLK